MQQRDILNHVSGKYPWFQSYQSVVAASNPEDPNHKRLRNQLVWLAQMIYVNQDQFDQFIKQQEMLEAGVAALEIAQQEQVQNDWSQQDYPVDPELQSVLLPPSEPKPDNQLSPSVFINAEITKVVTAVVTGMKQLEECLTQVAELDQKEQMIRVQKPTLLQKAADLLGLNLKDASDEEKVAANILAQNIEQTAKETAASIIQDNALATTVVNAKPFASSPTKSSTPTDADLKKSTDNMMKHLKLILEGAIKAKEKAQQETNAAVGQNVLFGNFRFVRSTRALDQETQYQTVVLLKQQIITQATQLTVGIMSACETLENMAISDDLDNVVNPGLTTDKFPPGFKGVFYPRPSSHDETEEENLAFAPKESGISAC